jgi:hypothetical protein
MPLESVKSNRHHIVTVEIRAEGYELIQRYIGTAILFWSYRMTDKGTLISYERSCKS